ncbi:LppM family (lipo)protein [Pseudonocardia sp. H11422]|uniref:LppM family (lipo)protein n=1 Tax=Pseudonocardia sp. H11422 TaxID=2835866 RepID=UPI001BDD8FC9|nr:DUF3153 domain-containing protein [Pseudonocardia sp. H11422]
MSSPVPHAPHRTRRRVLPLLMLAVLLVGTLLGGCARVRTALAVQPDDTVIGEIVLATPEASPQDTGPTVTVPEELESDVDVSTYRQDGYVGSLLRFSGLTFDQLSALTVAAGPVGDRAELVLRRAGNRVLVSGKVDLTTVPVDKADFQLKISFPGTVLETNGDADSGTVSWTFTPGEVGDISAAVAYADPNAPSPVSWTLGLGVLVAAAAGAVVLLARRTRNPPLTPPVR